MGIMDKKMETTIEPLVIVSNLGPIGVIYACITQMMESQSVSRVSDT